MTEDGESLVFAKRAPDFDKRMFAHSGFFPGASISCMISMTRAPRSIESSR